MAFLTVAQTARIQAVIDYLLAGSAGKHIDDRSVEELARIFGSVCGFTCGCPGSFQEGMRDEPFPTLLRALLCVAGPNLTAAQTARIEALIQYVQFGSAGKYIDERTAEDLAIIFNGACGFECRGCPGEFVEGLRDSPFSTLLTLILCADAGPVVPDVPVVPPGPTPCEGLWTFGVLAGETITNTGFTVIDGDLGLSPGSSVTGFPPGIVNGTQHITDVEAAAAKVQLTAEYLALEGMLGGTPVAGDLGGQTLSPGIYKSVASLEVTTADLTLDAGGDADAEFIFQIASTWIVANGRSIILTGGAKAGNVYYQVGSSATLGTTSVTEGSILALTSITIQTNAVLNGRALARNGSVTLDDNDITVPPC